MGRLFVEVIAPDGSGWKYACACGLDVASDGALVWEGVMGSSTPALLFRCSVNVDGVGPVREEKLTTGRYVLRDVRCRRCCLILGWQYLEVLDAPDQKYKERCMLLRQASLRRVNRVSGMVTAVRAAGPAALGAAPPALPPGQVVAEGAPPLPVTTVVRSGSTGAGLPQYHTAH